MKFRFNKRNKLKKAWNMEVDMAEKMEIMENLRKLKNGVADADEVPKSIRQNWQNIIDETTAYVDEIRTLAELAEENRQLKERIASLRTDVIGGMR